jgi:predicted nuclease with TOPRIM domain
MALEIQQSFNQMLSSAGVFAGLYAHQPNVQKKREAKQKLKEIGQEKEQLGQEKEEVEFQLNKMADEFVDIVEGSALEEDKKEEIYKVKTSLQKQYDDLTKREGTLAK